MFGVFITISLATNKELKPVAYLAYYLFRVVLSSKYIIDINKDTHAD